MVPPPMGFSRRAYSSGLPLPSPGDLPNSGIEPRSPELQADSLPAKSPGKPKTEQKYTQRDRSMLSCDRLFATLWTVARQAPGKNTGVGCYALLQGLFPTQGSNPGLLHCRTILYHLSQETPQADLGLGQVPSQALPRVLTCKIMMKIVFFCLFLT